MTKDAPADSAFWDDFRRVRARVAQELTAALAAQADITLIEYQVLATLAEAPRGRRRLMDVAAPLPLGRSGMTRVMDRLTGAGWVMREPSLEDRRGVVGVLTPAGRGLVRRATPVVAATLAQYFTGPLGASGRAAVRRACQRILTA
jgi:DNA-binding MarR family transcriptional regulator